MNKASGNPMRKFIMKPRSVFLHLLVVQVIFTSTISLAQLAQVPFKKPVTDVADSVVINYERLKRKWGENKEIQPRYEKQILFALSYFPELVSIKIKFQIVKGEKGIIDTRPTIGSLLRRGNKRKYLVTIYDSTVGRTRPLYSKADVNGQVGIMGHELSHIVSFKNSTGLDLMGLGIAHISTRYMDRYENNTDSVTIERGLGYQLIAWKQYLDKGFKAMPRNAITHSKKPVARKRYMSVDQIRRVMRRSKIYQLQ